MTTLARLLPVTVAVLLLAPTVALAGICYRVSGLTGPAAFDFVPQGSSADEPVPVVGAAHGFCGPGTPPAAIQGTVLGAPGGDSRLGFRLLASREACAGGEGEVVLAPPYEDGVGQVRGADGSVANIVLSRDPSGAACAVAAAPDSITSSSGCVPGSTTLCLLGNRFRATALGLFGRPRAGQAVTIGANGGFTFSPGNIEVVVKVLNACSVNNRFWVQASSSSNVEYTLTVTDTQTGTAKSYYNPLRQPGRPIEDTNAFATCP